MNSSILNLYDNVIRMTTTWPFLASWSASVSVRQHTLHKSVLLFMPGEAVFNICVRLYVCLHDDIGQDWRRSRSVAKHGGGTDDFSVRLNCMWRGRSEFILINCRVRSPDMTN